jgi:monovalent cation:H+ antiporter-2, CPA2 family
VRLEGIPLPEHSVLSDLLRIFAVSIAVVFLFQRLRLPSIAGFLVAGALIGPYGLNLVSDLQQVNVLAEIGVVLLLFTIGIEFSAAHLRAARRYLLVGGPLQVAAVVLLVMAIGRVRGLPLAHAFYWGCLLSLSSTAIVLKALTERGEGDSLYGRATIGMLIFQDLAMVPMMLMVPLLANENVKAEAVAGAVAESALLVGGIVAGAWVLVPRLLKQIVRSRSRELFLLTVIVLCLGIAWLTSQAGLSLALGAFIAGLVISESEYSHQALAEILPFRDSFNSLFFVSIGMLMDVRVLAEYPGLVAALIGAVLLGKFLAGGGAVLVMGYPPRVALLTGVALAQVGEFSFILAQAGQQVGLLAREQYEVFLAVSVVTMIITPFLIQAAPKLARRAEAVQRLRRWLPEKTTAHLMQAEAPRGPKVKDHVIVVGYGLNGQNLARVLAQTEIPYVVVDLDGETIRRESKAGVPIYYGDATNPAVLHHMRIEEARVLVLAISDPFSTRRALTVAKGLNPRLHVVVRTRYLREMEELHALGADEVVPEEFETSIEIFALVLRTYHLPKDFIVQKAEQVRREGYALLRRSTLPELAHHLRGGTMTDAEVETWRVETDSPALGKTLVDLAIRPRTGASVIAVTRNGITESNPSLKLRLESGDVVVLLGSRDQIRRAIGLLADHK